MRLAEHEFLSDDQKIQLTVFRHVPGSLFEEDVRVIINKGLEDHTLVSEQGGEVVLPPYGFVVESPTFVAFYALSWSGVNYGKPVLFTLRSLDGASIPWSSRIRIYHGFGDTRIKVKGEVHQVERESMIE
jgi:hypothetical protein